MMVDGAAFRYATHLIAMKNGALVAQGAPAASVAAELVEHIFGIAGVAIADSVTATPMTVPGRRPGKG